MATKPPTRNAISQLAFMHSCALPNHLVPWGSQPGRRNRSGWLSCWQSSKEEEVRIRRKRKEDSQLSLKSIETLTWQVGKSHLNITQPHRCKVTFHPMNLCRNKLFSQKILNICFQQKAVKPKTQWICLQKWPIMSYNMRISWLLILSPQGTPARHAFLGDRSLSLVKDFYATGTPFTAYCADYIGILNM